MTTSDAGEHWALDRKVPVAIIVTLVAQIIGFAWYAAKLDARVEEQGVRLAKTEAQIVVIDRDARDVSTRLVRVEEKIGAVLDIARRLERIVDRRVGGEDLPTRP